MGSKYGFRGSDEGIDSYNNFIETWNGIYRMSTRISACGFIRMFVDTDALYDDFMKDLYNIKLEFGFIKSHKDGFLVFFFF